MSAVGIVLLVAGLPVLAASLYLAVLAVLSRITARPQPGPSRLRFDVIVPAHNEESGIAHTVTSLLAVAYPREQFRVLVVADNCVDKTADVAAAAGAHVLVRTNLEQRGKGYALLHAFTRSLSDGVADAVVVVDADTLVSPNLLAAFADRLDHGALTAQADYRVRNPESSWRTRMMTLALAAFHGVRSLARERLGVSCGLRGNGMAFSHRVLREHPYNAFSIVEDLEYGIQLGYAGTPVHYVHEAPVYGQMVSSEGASRSQRRRWELGRKALVRQHAWPLLRDAWRRRSLLLLDLGLDLIVPPVGQLVAAATLGFVLSAAAARSGMDVRLALAVWTLSLGGIALYVLRGWMISGVGARGLLDLLWAPVYIVWKLSLRFKPERRTPKEWVRTTREIKM